MIAVSSGLAEAFLLGPAVLVLFKNHDTLTQHPKKLQAVVNY